MGRARFAIAAAGICGMVAAPATAHYFSSADLPQPSWRLLAPAPGPSLAVGVQTLPAPAPPMAGRFDLVGHEPLLFRGMNSALAVGDGYAYVGSRSDGTHAISEVLVVDVRNPAAPRVVGGLERGNPGESSRELRVIPDQDLLVVLYHGCSELIHRCVNGTQVSTSTNLATSRYVFYDIAGANAAAPKPVATYFPSRGTPQTPHEFYVWSDPARAGRVLLFQTTPTTDGSPLGQMLIADVSNIRTRPASEIATWRVRIGQAGRDNRLHSLTLTPDGRRAYLAYLGGGFLVADTSDFADNVPSPQVRLVTPVANRVFWTNPGAHSAIKIPGKPYAFTTDEVYGKLGGVLADHGCPWGWVRIIDTSNEAQPRLAGELRPPWTQQSACASQSPVRDNFSSFSAHNPTLLPDVGLLTWHSAGLVAVDLADPERPALTAQFLPRPLLAVQTEDPALSSGEDKAVMWSFPVVRDGLIYAVDLRNGLYILRYHGPHDQTVAATTFLDGNSNSGDALANEG